MKTWFSNASLHVAQKLSLWETCVLPIALYGLDSVGVDHTTIPLFSKGLLPHLRQVMRELLISHTLMDMHTELTAVPLAGLG